MLMPPVVAAYVSLTNDVGRMVTMPDVNTDTMLARLSLPVANMMHGVCTFVDGRSHAGNAVSAVIDAAVLLPVVTI